MSKFFLDEYEQKLREEKLKKTLEIYELSFEALDVKNQKLLKEMKLLKKDLERLDKENLELKHEVKAYKNDVDMLQENLKLKDELNKQAIDPDCLLTIR